MYYGIIYICAQQPLYKAFTGLKKTDLMVLQALVLINRPVSYMALYRILRFANLAMCRTSFQRAIDRQIRAGYVHKEYIDFTFYSLTMSGRAYIEMINAKLNEIVKEQLILYGNGIE